MAWGLNSTEIDGEEREVREEVAVDLLVAVGETSGCEGGVVD